jgi:hypothetical protein
MRLPRLLLSAGLLGGPLALAVLTDVSLTPPALAQVVKAAPILQPGVPKADDKKPAKPVDPVELDKQALEAAGLKADDAAGLIKYLKSRTLNDTDMGKIQGLIKKMGGENKFDDRIAAQDQLIQIGGQAVAPLRIAAQNNQDPEVVYRAKECVRRMEKEKSLGADVTVAVIRSLGRTKDPEASPTILGFLPLADSTLVVDTIQTALRDTAAGADGKPAKLLVDALGDENPTRRRIAALALIEGGTAEKRIRFPELRPKFVVMAKTDKDPGVRFVLARTLVAEARDKEAVEVLIDLMPDMSRGQSWQAEELLVQIAGKDAPPERCKHARDPRAPDKEASTNKAAREKTRDAWKKWWATAKDKTDLSKIDLKQTLRGHFVIATQFWGGIGQQINLSEYGQDDKERERMSFQVNNSVMDVLLLDNGRVLSLEHGTPSVNVRDLSGKVTATWTVPMEKNAQRFGFQPKGMYMRENGNLVVVHGGGVVELDKDGKEAFKYTRPEVNKQPQMDIAGAVRMKNGDLVLSLTTSKLIVLDDKGKEVEGRKPVQTGPPQQRSLIQQTGEDTVMLVEQQAIVEYDLKQGKAAGVKLQNVYSNLVGQRLPNGNILHSDNNYYPPRIVEKTPKNEEVWSFNVRDQNQNLIKAMVR